MIGQNEKNRQLNMFRAPLKQFFINGNHELVQLSKKITWQGMEIGLSVYYCSNNGRPASPIRFITGIVMLHRGHSQSNESVLERWCKNPYWQYFSGEVYSRHDFLFDCLELVKFRRRNGEEGASQIFKVTVDLFSVKEVQEKGVLINMTVQGRNVTFPTDTELQKKIIEKWRKLYKREGLRLRQTRKLESERKMEGGHKLKYQRQFDIFKSVLIQTKESNSKGYSIHQLQVNCIAKGKEHKKCEFTKVLIVKTQKSGIIVGIMNFLGNPYDGDILVPQFEQVEWITGRKPPNEDCGQGLPEPDDGKRHTNYLSWQTTQIQPTNGKKCGGASAPVIDRTGQRACRTRSPCFGTNCTTRLGTIRTLPV